MFNLKNILRAPTSIQKSEETVNSVLICSSGNFSFANNIVRTYLPSDKNEAVLFLKYVMKTITLDISSSLQAAMFYFKDVDLSWSGHILPTSFTTNNVKVELIDYEEKPITVDIEKTTLITSPWCAKRLPPILKKIKDEGFKNDEHNQHAVFYEDMDICVISNGYHSTAAGKYFGKGELKAHLCNTRWAYPHITTDGEYWYCDSEKIYNYNEPFKVKDFRFALLYEISKMIYSIESEKVNLEDIKLK